MLRLTDNPSARFPIDRPLAADLGLWAVAQLKSRQEKAFARDLARREISYYMPMAEKRVRRRDNGKLRKSILPLFTGYVAFALAREGWEDLYATNRVINLIPVPDQPEFVAELEQIRRVLEGGARVEPAPTFQRGQRVRVEAGPMLGIEGEVVRHSGEMVFIIRVNMFQQAVKVEIDEAYLAAI